MKRAVQLYELIFGVAFDNLIPFETRGDILLSCAGEQEKNH